MLLDAYISYGINNACIYKAVIDTEHLFPSLSLPKAVKRRVNALKNLQVKSAHIEAKFYEEVHELERKYAALYQPLFDKVRVDFQDWVAF